MTRCFLEKVASRCLQLTHDIYATLDNSVNNLEPLRLVSRSSDVGVGIHAKQKIGRT